MVSSDAVLPNYVHLTIYRLQPVAIFGNLYPSTITGKGMHMDPLDLISQGKIKRFFRATRKLTQPGVFSHITQRAAGKEPLFLEDDLKTVNSGR